MRPACSGFLSIGFVWIVLGGMSVTTTEAQSVRPRKVTALQSALNFLSDEVPKWSIENKCFSCHNNGDAARALFQARRQSIRIDQEANGSWKLIADGSTGSPTTYGDVLATVIARQVLVESRSAGLAKQIGKATVWLNQQRPQTVLDSAAVLFGNLVDAPRDQRLHCLKIIRRSQTRSGGWGPYEKSAAEPFDTSIVILGLSHIPSKQKDRELLSAIRRGRQFLIDTQLEDGSWLETTRPSNQVSYAQRLSTAGWATMALLATRPVGK